MDYKYIEQLLERYWNCETTLEEETILRAFFAQEALPEQFKAYQPLFQGLTTLHEAHLGEAFDKRVLSRIDRHDEVVQAQRITLTRRLMPLYKAAASVAIILTLGNAAQRSFNGHTTAPDYNYDSYYDSYNDPATAYDQMSTALDLVSKGLNESMADDSLRKAGNEAENRMQ